VLYRAVVGDTRPCGAGLGTKSEMVIETLHSVSPPSMPKAAAEIRNANILQSATCLRHLITLRSAHKRQLPNWEEGYMPILPLQLE